jgi:hypothetical protein
MTMFATTSSTAKSVALALAVFGLNGAAHSLDLGDASVMSMQGQRLKIAVPYGSKPGEKIPVLRFSIDSIETNGTKQTSLANDFVISQPEFRNVIYLQSRDPVSASQVKLVLNVADSPATQVAYNLVVPPLKFANNQIDDSGATKKQKVSRGKRKSSPIARAAAPKAAKATSMLNQVGKGCSC